MTRFTLLAMSCAALAGLSTPACDDAPPGAGCNLCTDEFRLYTVTVLDAGGIPVEDVVLTRTNRRTGKTLEPGWLGLTLPGVYLVVDDALLAEFSIDGDRVRVDGSASVGTFTREYVFASDECGCHVVRLSGPDTVVVGN